MKFSLFLFAVLPLVGCGTGLPDKPSISRSANKATMPPAPAPTPAPAGTDSTQTSSDNLAVIPPQQVIGGYLVSVLQSSASLPPSDCGVAFVESGLTSASIVSRDSIAYLPFFKFQQIGTVSIVCGDGIQVAEKVLSEADRQELSKAVVAKYNQESRFVARLKVPALGQTLEIVVEERIASSSSTLDSTGGTSTASAGSSPVTMKDDSFKQPMDNSSGSSTSPSASTSSSDPTSTDKMSEPLKDNDTKPPVIQGTRFMELSGKRVISLVGANDDVELAKNPYSFDGGLTWTETPQGRFSMADKIPFGTVQVKDAAGNVLNVRIVLPSHGLSKI